MKNFFFVLIFLSAIIISCGNKSNNETRYNLSKSKSITIPIDNETVNKTFCYQFITLNDTDYYITIDWKTNSINIYDFKAKKLFRKIKLFKEGPSQNLGIQANGFVVKNFDTILIVSMTPMNVYMINIEGDLLKKIDYSRIYNGREILMSNPSGNNIPILNNDCVYFTNMLNFFKYNFRFNQQAIAGSRFVCKVNIVNDSCTLMDLTFPKEFVNRNLQGIRVLRTIGMGKDYVYKFSYGDEIFVTSDNVNYKTYTIVPDSKHEFPDLSPKYFYDFLKGVEEHLTHNEYKRLIFDQFNDVFYLIIQEPITVDNKTDLKTCSMYPLASVIILDKDFKFIGRKPLENLRYDIMTSFVTEDGLYISEDHPENPDFNEDEMHFRLFKLEKK